jgi:Tfp pilus assembly pilus retraction ATPase PilT
MLKLEHFYHLPQLDPLVEHLVNEESGLVVVAGLDPRSRAVVSGRREPFVHSGRSAIFRILMREILAANEHAKAIVVTEDESVVRIPRQASRRVRLWLVQPPAASYAARIADAVRQGPELLVIDKLCAENLESALGAAQGGLHVLSQLDAVFRGSDVARDLLVQGTPE